MVSCVIVARMDRGKTSSAVVKLIDGLLGKKITGDRECKQCGREPDSDGSARRDCSSNEIAEYKF